jgi:hypothetical protein
VIKFVAHLRTVLLLKPILFLAFAILSSSLYPQTLEQKNTETTKQISKSTDKKKPKSSKTNISSKEKRKINKRTKARLKKKKKTAKQERKLKHRLHIMYSGDISKTSSVYLISALERLSAIKDNGIKIKKVNFAPSIRIKNLSIFSDLDEQIIEKLPQNYDQLIKRFTPEKKISVLESNFDSLFSISDFAPPIIDKIKENLERTNRRSDKVRGFLGKITDDDGNTYDAVLFEDKKTYSNDVWQAQTSYRYFLSINGVEGEVISFGNFYGGFATLLPVLEDELKKSPNDVLLLETGGAFSEYGFNYANPVFELVQYDAIMPNLHDIAGNYNELTSPDMKLPLINSNVLDPSSKQTLFKDHIILNKDGVRVGIIALVSPGDLAKTYVEQGKKVIIKDPIETAKKLLKELFEKADLKIAIVNLSPEELVALEKISGLNIIIGKKYDEPPPYPQRYILFKQDKESLLQYPYFLGSVGSKYLSSLKFYFAQTKHGVEERGLFWKRYPLDIYAKKDPVLQPLENRSIIASYGEDDPILLPDYRTLFPEKEDKSFTYPVDEVSTLMANVLLKETNSDVAVYTKRIELDSSVTGEISESMIRAWFRDKNEQILTARIKGSTLINLVNTMSNYAADDDPSSPPAIISGIDSMNMTVKDKSISPSEYYSIVTVRQVFDAVDLYPSFRGLDINHERFILGPKGLRADKKGKKTKAPDVLISYLKREKIKNSLKYNKLISKGKNTSILDNTWRKELERSMTDFDMHDGPFWRINLKRVAFEFRGHKVKSSDDYFFVPDARVQPVDETTISANIDASFELYGERWNWETGAVLDFMDMSIISQGTDLSTVSMDNALIYTDLRYKLLRFSPNYFGRSLGPFLNIAYDTQFKPTFGNPRKRKFRITPGVNFSDGILLDNLRIGWIFERDYTFAPSKNEQGLSFYTDAYFFMSKINSTIETYVDLKYFLDSNTDTDTDLGLELEYSLSLKVPIYRSFFIAPYFKYFLFRGKVDPIRRFGHASTIGVSVGFSEVIKP